MAKPISKRPANVGAFNSSTGSQQATQARSNVTPRRQAPPNKLSGSGLNNINARTTEHAVLPRKLSAGCEAFRALDLSTLPADLADGLKDVRDWLPYAGDSIRKHAACQDRSTFPSTLSKIKAHYEKQNGQVSPGLLWAYKLLLAQAKASWEQLNTALRGEGVDLLPEPTRIAPRQAKFVQPKVPVPKRDPEQDRFIARNNLPGSGATEKIAKELMSLTASVKPSSTPAPALAQAKPAQAAPAPRVAAQAAPLARHVNKPSPIVRSQAQRDLRNSAYVNMVLDDILKEFETEEKDKALANSKPVPAQALQTAAASKIATAANQAKSQNKNADQKNALIQKIQAVANSISKRDAPKPDLAGVQANLGPLRKAKILQQLNLAFDAHLPVLDVSVDAHGQVTRIKVGRSGIRSGRKWIHIDWSNGQPQFRATPKRFPGTWDAAKFSDKWKHFAGSVNTYDAQTEVQGAQAGSVSRLQRATQAWSRAAQLLQYAKPNDPESYLRADLQQMIRGSAEFVKAYESGTLDAYFKNMSDAEKGKHVSALLVESFRDCYQMMAGRLSMEQLLELMRLFPDNPAKAENRDFAPVADPKAISRKLKELLGENYQLVGTMFHLSKTFFDLACEQLETKSLTGLPKNCWITYGNFFGLAGFQLDIYMNAILDQQGRTEVGKKMPMLAYHLANNAADFFELEV